MASCVPNQADPEVFRKLHLSGVIHQNMAHTFQVSELPIDERVLQYKPEPQPWYDDRGIKKRLEGTRIFSSDSATVGGTSPVFDALSLAFNSHFPLEFTPDSIWLTCLNGLVHRIAQDPEKFRSAFVTHEGQKLLTVVVQSPLMNLNPATGWNGLPAKIVEELISGLSTELKANLNPKRHELVICNFSTTTKTDRLSSEVALMGAMKHYFSYNWMCACGLTKVSVLGTPEDWQDIIDRAHALSEFDLEWWTRELVPVLQEFKKACEGSPDLDFWKRAYLEHRYGSGGQFDVSGWINVFYPYVSSPDQPEGKMVRNTHLAWQLNDTHGSDPDEFPFGLSKVPVKIDNHGTLYNCALYGGLCGVSRASDDHTVRPVSGYSLQLIDKG